MNRIFSYTQSIHIEILSGLAFTLLFGIGTAITLIGSPQLGGAPESMQRYFLEQSTHVYLGGILSMLSVPFLIWFSGCIWMQMTQIETIPKHYSLIAFGSSLVASALVATEVIILTVGAMRVQNQGNISLDISSILYDLSTAIGGMALPVALATLFIAFGLTALQHKQFMSRNLAFLTILIGLLSTIIPIGTIMFFISIIWISVISISVYRTAHML